MYITSARTIFRLTKDDNGIASKIVWVPNMSTCQGRMQIVLCILYKALKVFGVFGPQFLEGGGGGQGRPMPLSTLLSKHRNVFYASMNSF